MFHVNKDPKPTSVGLGGDGDELELLDEIETTFGVTFSDEECERIFSLGDAFQIICSKLPKDPDNHGKCLTAMAYYRLNNALGNQGKILPATRVRLPHGWSAKHFQNQLEKKSGLNLEWLTTASPGVVTLAILQFITWIAAPIMLSGFSAFLGCVLIFVFSHLLWRVANNRDKRVWIFDGTLGDLCRRAAVANSGILISLGGRWRESDVWSSMTRLIEDQTGFPREQMTPETQFI